MADPISFTSQSPRFGLPYLFAGQAQKEFYVNEAHSLVDFLLHPAVEGELNVPPAAPEEGQCWLVGANPVGDWMNYPDHLAGRVAGCWVFCSPREGLRVYDCASKQIIFYLDGWQRIAAPTLPLGGQVIDIEAREGLNSLIETLRNSGILPAS